MLAGLITAPEPLRPVVQPEAALRPSQRRAPADARAVDDRRATSTARASREPIQLAAPRPDRALPVPLLRGLLQASGSSANPAFGATRRGPHTSCCSPAACASPPRSTPSSSSYAQTAVRSVLAYPERPRRGDDGHRPAHRLRPRDGGRQGRRLLEGLRRRSREPGDRQGRHAAARPARPSSRSRWWRRSRTAYSPSHGLRGARHDRHPARTTARCGTSRTPRAAGTGS